MKIRKRGNSWQLDVGVVDGRRRQFSFKSRKEAEAEMARLELEGEVAPLSRVEERRFAALRDRLEAEAPGVSLESAVEFYLQHGAGRVRQRMELGDMIEGCLAAKWEEGKRERYLSQLKCSARSFLRWAENAAAGSSVSSVSSVVWADEVRREQVAEWLRSSGWQPKTRNVYLADLRTVFEWGRREGAVAVNPCDGVERARLEDGEIEVLSPARCARLLARVLRPARWGRYAGEDFSDLRGYVVLAMFCGIRPEELQRLTWDAVNLEEGTVVIAGRQAKTRSRRVVDLSPNARAWLSLVPRRARDEGGRVCPRNFRKRWERLRRACGWAVSAGESGATWPHDGLRHSYASYHYALHRNELLLQTQMGHSSGQLLFKHYRALATRRQAERFWGLVPPVRSEE